MSAAEYNAHLLAHPGGGRRGSHGAAHGGYDASREAPGVARVRRASPEEDLHRQVFGWIFAMQTANPILGYMMHVPNGGARSKGEAGKLKAMVDSGNVTWDVTNATQFDTARGCGTG